MKKTKKVIIFILSALCLCSLALFTACNKSATIEPVEKKYGYVYSSQYEGACDPDISIDGKLDEAVWQNKKWYTSKYCADIKDIMPKLTVTAFNTKYGAYIGVKVRDNNILYNGMLNPSKNSTLEFYFYADKTDTVEEDLDRSLRRAFMMDYAGELYSTGERMKRAFDIEGEINSGNTVGATVEIFIPWSEMGIDVSDGVYPQKFRLLPTYRPVLKGNTTHTPLFNKPFNPMHHINDYYIFDEDGYTDEDVEGATVGDAYNGTAKSGSWDLEELDKGVISVTDAGEYNSIFFKDAYCENFVAETTIVPLGGTPRRGGWFSGFFILTTTGNYYTMMLDMRSARYVAAKDGGNALDKFSLTTLTEAHTDWEQINKINKANPAASDKKIPERSGVKFKIIKDRENFYYFADDEYLYSESVDFVQGRVYAGLFNMNAYARYENYSFRALDDEEVADELFACDVYRFDAEVTTDGGEALAEREYVVKGDSATIKFTCESGYKLASVILNDNDITETVKEDAQGGVYTIADFTANVFIEVAFEKIEAPLSFNGYLKAGGESVDGNVYLIDRTSGAIRYDAEATEDDGFGFLLEAGEYELFVKNYLGSTIFDITEDEQLDIQLDDFVYLDTENARISYLNIDFINQSANSVKGNVTEWFLVGESSKNAYLSANVYNYDLDGFTVEDDYGNNVQFYFAYQGVYILVDHDWNLPDIEYEKPEERHKKYSFFNEANKGKVLSALSADDLSGELTEIAVSEGVLYVSIGGIGKLRLELSEFNENFNEDTEYRLGFSTYNANATKYPASGAMYKNIDARYGEKASEKVDAVKNACAYEESPLGEELYDETFVTKVGGNAISYFAKKAGAQTIEGAEIAQNVPFMIYADIESSFFNGVGFVVGTLGDDNSGHVMFNWRPNRDIYVTREANGEKWKWSGHDNDKYPCDRGVTKETTRIALVYQKGLYLFYVDGELYLNVSESADIGWGTVIKDLVGTTGNKKIGISVLYGSVLISDHGWTTDTDKINDYIGVIPFYKNSKVKVGDDVVVINATKAVGAFVFDDAEVLCGENYAVSVSIDETNAENVGFVIGTIGESGENHVMFDWRNKNDNKDIYIWRNGGSDWDWTGVEDNKYPCAVERKPSTLTLVYKNGKYYMFIDGERVLNVSEDQSFAWSSVKYKEVIGTEGKIKIGLSASFGSVTFSGFTVSTDVGSINAFVPD